MRADITWSMTSHLRRVPAIAGSSPITLQLVWSWIRLGHPFHHAITYRILSNLSLCRIMKGILNRSIDTNNKWWGLVGSDNKQCATRLSRLLVLEEANWDMSSILEFLGHKFASFFKLPNISTLHNLSILSVWILAVVWCCELVRVDWIAMGTI